MVVEEPFVGCDLSTCTKNGL